MWYRRNKFPDRDLIAKRPFFHTTLHPPPPPTLWTVRRRFPFSTYGSSGLISGFFRWFLSPRWRCSSQRDRETVFRKGGFVNVLYVLWGWHWRYANHDRLVEEIILRSNVAVPLWLDERRHRDINLKKNRFSELCFSPGRWICGMAIKQGRGMSSRPFIKPTVESKQTLWLLSRLLKVKSQTKNRKTVIGLSLLRGCLKSCSCLPQVGAASAARTFLRIFPFPYWFNASHTRDLWINYDS